MVQKNDLCYNAFDRKNLQGVNETMIKNHNMTAVIIIEYINKKLTENKDIHFTN